MLTLEIGPFSFKELVVYEISSHSLELYDSFSGTWDNVIPKVVDATLTTL